MTRIQYRAAIRDLLVSFPATLMVTANFNAPSDLTAGRSALRGLHARLDRRVLGRTWSKQPNDARSLAIWLPEHLASNTHWHGLMKLPADASEAVIEEMPKMWVKIVPQGQLNVKSTFSTGGAAGYMTKEENLEHFLVSSEFHS